MNSTEYSLISHFSEAQGTALGSEVDGVANNLTPMVRMPKRRLG
jgi:hypothetical protein